MLLGSAVYFYLFPTKKIFGEIVTFGHITSYKNVNITLQKNKSATIKYRLGVELSVVEINC